MAWVQKHAPASANFSVITSEDDTAAEWFPALTDRVAPTAYQGSEWRPGSAFQSAVDAATAARNCAGLVCAAGGADYVYFSADCRAALRATVPEDTVVYRGGGVLIASVGGT